MSIPPRFLDEIRNRLTLSEIIGRRISVQRSGREFKACCPFHNEKTPSFTINDDKQFYHCFGCGAHGDVIGFVMQHDNVSFIDAVETLASEAGLQMPKPDPKAVEKAEKVKDLYDLMDKAASWMQDQISANQNADVLEYLEGRGIDETIRENFRIGYTPADGQALRKHLNAQGFSDTQMREVGLLKDTSHGAEPYIFFRDRVMFPVCDRRGRVVAFGGRILPESLRPQSNSDFKPPKYINTADTILFDKGRMLYAESIARQAAREGHTLIVTEGYMDVIACNKSGFKGAVAPMGTALTEDQIVSLWSMMVDEQKIPVLCFDGDNAGRRAASRACERLLPLLQPGKSARFAFLPEGEDPDSLLRSSGAVGLRGVLSASLSLFDFLWFTHTAGRDLDMPEARAGLSKVLHKQVSIIADPEVQKHYRELVRTRVSEKFFQPYKKHGTSNEVNRARGSASTSRSSPRPRPVLPKKSDLPQRILLAAMLNNPQIYHSVEEEFGQFVIDSQALDRLRQEAISCLHEDKPLDTATLHAHLNSCGFEQEMHDILNESVYVHAAFSREGACEATDKRQVIESWLALYKALQGKESSGEVKAEWKAAFESSNEELEEKLRDLVRIRRFE